MSLSTVSATNIQDPSGQVFANGTWSLYFTPTFGRSGPFTDGGVAFTKIYGGSLDANGSFSQANVNRNDTISPAGSMWLLVVTPAVSGQSFQVLLNVNNAVFSATTAINAVISLISVASTPLTRAYKDSEVVNSDGAGALYYDETLKTLKVWDAVAGVWLPVLMSGSTVLPATKAAIASNWLRSYDATTGLFTASQPVEGDIVNLSTDLAAINTSIAAKAPLASPTFTGTVTAAAVTEQSLNGLMVVFADQFASIQAAINALPAGGGVVDARSPNVNLTMGAIDTGSNTKIVTLLLGPFTYTFTQIVVRQGFNILGAGLINTTLQNVGTNANPAFVIPQVSNNAIIFHWSDFQVLGLAGNTSQDGIFFDASTLTNAGVELGTFMNIQLTGFKGSTIHLKATQDGVSGSIGAMQGLTFINVTAIRPTGATGATQNALRIEGGCGQIKFENCWFTGASSDTGVNVFVGTTGTQAPYSIHFQETTNQNGFAYLFDGAIGCTCEKDHFEVIKGCYNFANTASPIVGFRSVGAYINSNVAVNAGNGYIVNIPIGTPNVDVLIDSPMIGGQPDKTIVNATNGVNVRMINAQYLPGNTPVNVSVSSGSTFQGTPAATLDVKCCRTVQLSASATSITTLKSGLQPGETITFYTTGGSAQFATGGNLSLGNNSSPLVINTGDSVTFERVDQGAAAFVLVGYSLGSNSPLVKRIKASQGTTQTNGNIVLSAGFGNTATAVFSPGIVSKDQAFLLSITANGTGIAANPTITITYADGSWGANAPIPIVLRNDTATPFNTPPHTVSTTPTTLVINFNGTPVAGQTYGYAVFVIGTT